MQEGPTAEPTGIVDISIEQKPAKGIENEAKAIGKC